MQDASMKKKMGLLHLLSGWGCGLSRFRLSLHFQGRHELAWGPKCSG
eukprot:COSAG03_NODE_6986_length_978_cov_0.913636_3_plen_46_part_01